MDPRLKQLNFVELDLISELPKHNSLRGLARSREIMPSQVSKIIKKFETLFEIEIMKRSATGVLLTPQGAQLASGALQILKQAEVLSAHDYEIEASFERILTVGTRAFINTALAPYLVHVIQRIEPKTGIRFVDFSPDELIQACAKGAVEIAISIDKLALGKNWHQTQIGTLEWGLFARSQHPLTFGAKPEDLKQYRILRHAYWDGKNIANGEDLIPVETKHKNFGHEIQTAFTAIAIVQKTDDLCFIPTLAAHEALTRGDIARIPTQWSTQVTRPLMLAVHDEKINQKVYRELVSNLKSVLSSH